MFDSFWRVFLCWHHWPFVWVSDREMATVHNSDQQSAVFYITFSLPSTDAAWDWKWTLSMDVFLTINICKRVSISEVKICGFCLGSYMLFTLISTISISQVSILVYSPTPYLPTSHPQALLHLLHYSSKKMQTLTIENIQCIKNSILARTWFVLACSKKPNLLG